MEGKYTRKTNGKRKVREEGKVIEQRKRMNGRNNKVEMMEICVYTNTICFQTNAPQTHIHADVNRK